MDRREGNMYSPRPEYMAEITNQRLAIRDASNPKPSAESVIVLTAVTSELPFRRRAGDRASGICPGGSPALSHCQRRAGTP